jgi:hypothetical protein
MSEFELLRGLRDLRRDEEPTRDLFPAIAARLDDPQSLERHPRSRSARARPWAIAATLAVVSASASWLAWQQRGVDTPAAQTVAKAERESPRLMFDEARRLRAEFSDVRSQWGRVSEAPPLRDDVNRYTADRQLAFASGELMKALAVQPNSPYLLRLLRRTEEARLRNSRPTA